MLLDAVQDITEKRGPPPAVLDFLYPHSRTSLPREAWEAAVREARAFATWMRQMDRDERELRFQELVTGHEELRALRPGTLVLTFHGCLPIAARWLFHTALGERGMIFGRGGTRAGEVRTRSRGHYRDTLFGALRHLQDGGQVFLAVDGQQGRRSSEIQIFGRRLMLGDGAAFLAHAARCPTIWYAAVRRQDVVRPFIVEGPTATANESAEAFESRLHSFCRKQIETIFSGDPRNIVVSSRWNALFTTS